MEIDYNTIVQGIGECIQYALPLGILIGLIERIMGMVIRAATGRGD